VRNSAGELVGFGKVTRDLTETKILEEDRLALLEAEQTARATAEAAVARLQAVQHVTEVGLADLSFQDLLQALLTRVVEVMSADTVVVLTKEGDDLVVIAAIGAEEAARQAVRVPHGTGFAGQIAEEGRSIAIEDLEQSDVPAPYLRAHGVRSLLGVPLVIQGEVRGVLHIGSLEPRRFSEEESELLQLIADRVAMNIEHARLIEAERVAHANTATAEATARLREQFLGITAHELKTPLTVVHGYALMLKRAIERGTLQPAALKTAVDEITTHSSRLDTLINDLLETSRIHEGRMRLDPAPMDLTELAEDVVRRFIDGPESSPLHSILVLAPEPVEGEWDVGRLDQVITNLVSNAIKYSPGGGEVTVSVRNLGPDEVELKVSDQGVGIARSEQRDLFQPFSRVRSNDRFSGGIGLGLFLSAQFVQRHGGTIEVDSEAGRGSTFIVRLPRVAVIEPDDETSE
jgi:signal transduction histidine kinase